jgi:phosphatidylglycerophosphatase A
MKRIFITIIAAGFGTGYLPVASGTWGSALAAVLYWALFPSGFSAALLVIAATALSIPVSTAAEKWYGKKDDSHIVVDEFVGMWVSLLFLPHTVPLFAAAFVLFRIFDVVKPFFIRRIQSLPGGWGIVADDFFAGILTNVVLQSVLYLWR